MMSFRIALNRFGIIVFLMIAIIACGPLENEVQEQANQFNKELGEIDDYLESLSIVPEIDVNSKLRYLVQNSGDETVVLSSDSIRVTYQGFVLGETTPFTTGVDSWFSVRNLPIVGWQIGMTKIGEGGEITVYVPSFQAYGPEGTNLVPGNTSVIFNIKLLEVRKSSVVTNQLNEEVAKIDAFVANDSTVQIDSATQIRFKILEPGNEVRPTVSNDVSVNYNGYFLDENKTSFDRGDDITFRLSSVIQGWQVGLPKIGEGGTIILYIPSLYAYGTTGTNGIPANSTLAFEIDLLDVK